MNRQFCSSANHKRNAKFFILAGLLTLLLPYSVAQAQVTTTGEPAQTIDVRSEVWPILRDRCVHCHGPDVAEGGLQLTTKEQINAGGHSGIKMLGSIDDCELLRRVTSTNDAYRMPKDELPLSEMELDVLRRWVAAGAPWPDGESLFDTPPTKLAEKFSAENFNKSVDKWIEWNKPLEILYPFALTFAIVILLIERSKLRQQQTETKSEQSIGWKQRLAVNTTRMHYVVGILIFVLIGFWRYHSATVAQLETRIQKSAAETHRYVRPAATSRYQIPKPHRPKHPPRLGGVYYRGNDERNDKLYNGGYYRTAVMRLALVNSNGLQLKWNDAVDLEELFIEVVIEKAPYATPELFRDQAMENSVISNGLGIEGAKDKKVHFQTMEPGEKWRAIFPLDRQPDDEKEVYSQTLFIGDGGSSPHYGIKYDVQIVDGKIAPTSQMWMGAILLTGSVVVPAENTMPLTEWFDFLPIPEIENGNSVDPELLGIPEHRDDQYGK